MASFNDFLRGYPYSVTAQSNVQLIEYENGAEQRRDFWGKMKKQFDVTFNVMTKAEMLAILSHYESKSGPGTTFSFTCPVMGVTYNVRYLENSMKMERRFFGTYFGSCRLIEVF